MLTLYRYRSAEPTTATKLWFDRMDINQDSLVDAAEFYSVTSSVDIFTALDCDRSESLSQREFESVLSQLDPFWFYEEVE